MARTDHARGARLKLGLSIVAAAAPLAAHAAVAQDPAEVGTEADSAPQQADKGVAAPVDDGGLADIVVTAQRRSENLQNVPIAITAVTPARLEELNLRSVDSLQLVTPSLVFNKGFGYVQTFIRGVGSDFTTGGLESAVGVYVDGAYLARGHGAVFDLLDTSGVQVLKGPQGSLYGRNATGGAILVSTADPTFDSLSGHVIGEYGNYDHVLGEAVLNAPLSDTVGFRFAGRYSKDDGYVTNRFDGGKLGGRESYILRGKLAFQVTPDLSAVLAVEHSRIETDTQASRQTLPAPICVGCIAFPTSTVDRFYEADIDFIEKPVYTTTSANLKVSASSGIFEIVSTTAFYRQSVYNPSDQDYSAAPLFNFRQYSGGDTFTQDLVLSSDSGSWLNGVFGLSYLDDDTYYDVRIDGAPFGPLQPFNQNRVRTHSAAVFGEFTMAPTERIKLTIGGRYTYDDRELAVHNNVDAVLAFTGGLGQADFRRGAAFRAFTPRIVLAYDAGPVNFYASYNRGFKAGGFTTPSFIEQDGVRPETIDSYELGAKFVSDDRRLHANLSLFHYDYSDVQVRIIDLASGGGVIQNAASARGKGAEFDMQFQPLDWIELFGGLSYLHARYRDYPGASNYQPAIDPVTGDFAGGLVTIPDGEQLAGFPLNRAPDWTAFGGFNIEAPVGAWKLQLSGVARYSSRYVFTPGAGGALRLDQQEPFTVVNLSGGLGPDDDRFQIGFFVNNLTDRKYIEFAQTGNYGASVLAARPRSYGVRLTYDY